MEKNLAELSLLLQSMQQ
jgi:hypothetical protein